MDIENFVKQQQAKRAAKGLCVHYIHCITGEPTVYAAADEYDKQQFIKKAKLQGREIISS